MAERVCGGAVRHSPFARGVGCLGGGTKGCAQRCFLHAHSVGIRPLRTRPVDLALFDGRICACPWSDVETDAGDAAVRAVTLGLLAAGANQRSAVRRRTSAAKVVPRKDSIARALGRFKHRHVSGPTRSNRLDGAIANVGTN